MRNSTRLVVALAILLMATGTFSACASKKKTAEGPPTAETKSESVEESKQEAAKGGPSGGVEESASQEPSANGMSGSSMSAEELASKRKAEEEAKFEKEEAKKPFSPEAMEKVHFDFDKSSIKPEFRDVLAKDAMILKAHPSENVTIEGHCDERGMAEYNLALGERRGWSVKKYLTSLGINESRMSVISYGFERPVDPGHNEEAWAKNRRAQFSK